MAGETKYIVKIPRFATRQSIEVVRAISRYHGEYLIGVPQAFKTDGNEYSKFVFHRIDFIHPDGPKIKRALAQVNFKPVGEEIYHPISFLQNHPDSEYRFKSDIFQMRLLADTNKERQFKYNFRDLEELTLREELATLPVNDSEGDSEKMFERLQNVKLLK